MPWCVALSEFRDKTTPAQSPQWPGAVAAPAPPALLQKAQGYGQIHLQGSSLRTLALTQEQLSLILGASRQTTHGILNDLKDCHILDVQRGQLEILDLPELQELCQ